MAFPQTSRSLVLKKADGAPPGAPPGSVYHNVVLENRNLDPNLLPEEILVKISAVAFNHRDVSRRGNSTHIMCSAVFGIIVVNFDHSYGLERACILELDSIAYLERTL